MGVNLDKAFGEAGGQKFRTTLLKSHKTDFSWLLSLKFLNPEEHNSHSKK